MFGLTPYNRRNRGVERRSPNLFGMEDFFEGFFNDSLFPAFFANSREMRVDIKENEKDYVLEAELPGINKENISLELKDDILTIAVEQNEQVDEEKENYIRRERRACSMSRSFQIANVKNEDVSASFNNGILTISLPKQIPGKNSSKQIEIQ